MNKGRPYSQSSVRAMFAVLFRRLPNFRGKTRSIRIINRVLNWALSDHLVASELKTGDLFILDMRSRTEYIAHYTGSYDSQMIEALISLFRPGFTVLDVGANIGFYAVPFAKRLKELEGELLCFEPVPTNFSRLKENLALNKADLAAVYPLALSDQPATLKMTLREDFSGGGATGNAAVLIRDQADTHFRTVDVTATRLDDFVLNHGLDKIDFIKVDIEGHEDLFLEGAAHCLERFRPLILSEFNEEYFRRRNVDLDLWLAGFSARHRYVGLRPGENGTWCEIHTLLARRNTDDVLLTPREKLAETMASLNRISI